MKLGITDFEHGIPFHKQGKKVFVSQGFLKNFLKQGEKIEFCKQKCRNLFAGTRFSEIWFGSFSKKFANRKQEKLEFENKNDDWKSLDTGIFYCFMRMVFANMR